MPILHLGIIDIPYGLREALIKKTTKAKKGAKPTKPVSVHVAAETTGDVAEILENKYHIYEHFWQLHKNEVAQALEQSMADAIETLMNGGPASRDPLLAATSDMEAKFKAFLANRELDSLGYPGIPTKAAQEGVSHRFKHPFAKRASRPSFIDTGLYQQSFKMWVD